MYDYAKCSATPDVAPLIRIKGLSTRQPSRLCITKNYADKGLCAAAHKPFWFIENNFLAGRTFASWEDLNNQARQWCDKVNSTYKKYIHAVPRELFAVERPFWFTESNFLAGRTFASWEDLNQRARQWCDKVNSTYKKPLLSG